MLGEASSFGLRLDRKRVDKYVFGVGGKFQAPDFLLDIHDSYKGLYKIFSPKFREISKGSLIHDSVAYKINETNYKPINLESLAGMKLEKDQNIVYWP